MTRGFRKSGAMVAVVAMLSTLWPSLTASAAPHDDAEAGTSVVEVDKFAQRFSLSAMDRGEPAELTALAYYYPGGMNSAEFWFCSNPSNMPSCATAKGAADDALAQAQAKFPASSLYQGKGDAFRHCYWSARMTIDLGSSAAKGFGDRHESDTPAGPDKNMDLANNSTGRSVGLSYTSYSKASARCDYLARNNRLVTLK